MPTWYSHRGRACAGVRALCTVGAFGCREFEDIDQLRAGTVTYHNDKLEHQILG